MTLTVAYEKDPPSKEFQIAALKRLFDNLNPDESSDIVDFNSFVDPSLSLAENIDNLMQVYPYYQWRGEPRPSIREELARRLAEIIDAAKNEGVSNTVIRNALNDIGIETTINRIQRGVPRSLYDDALKQLDQLKSRFGEIVEVAGKPTRVEHPEPQQQAERLIQREERYAEVLGMRILTTKNLLDVLGVTAETSDSDVNRSYRAILSLYHPDVYSGPDATEITRRINEAYQALNTGPKRAAYAATLTVPTAEVQVSGRPVIYCQKCGPNIGLVPMKYEQTYGPYSSGRSYEVYRCPTPGCNETRTVNFLHGQFLGIG